MVEALASRAVCRKVDPMHQKVEDMRCEGHDWFECCLMHDVTGGNPQRSAEVWAKTANPEDWAERVG